MTTEPRPDETDTETTATETTETSHSEKIAKIHGEGPQDDGNDDLTPDRDDDGR